MHGMFSEHFKQLHMREHAEGYVPKPGDLVMLEGVQSRLLVISVDPAKKTATVSTPTTPTGVYTAPWSKLACLDESQNAPRG
jgi:hypothetical protein